mmetsp:Transcript_50365/g.109496  ORF Transcript_50365/g.109496 Transcript_50365/m.109496 type:complete len:86 (-) Transcript_50365:18-275(-)
MKPVRPLDLLARSLQSMVFVMWTRRQISKSPTVSSSRSMANKTSEGAGKRVLHSVSNALATRALMHVGTNNSADAVGSQHQVAWS